MKEVKNILIIDDHKIVRDGIKFMLENQPEYALNVYDAGDENELYFKLELYPIDLIIMDIEMPGKNGFVLTEEVKQKFPKIKVLCMSMHDEEYVIKRMIKSGANGYILKNCDVEDLVAAIQQVYSKGKFFSTEIAEKLLNPYHDDDDENIGSKISQLSKREKEILQLIIEEYTSEEISVTLNISKRTVDTHRKNILIKTNAKNTVSLVKYAMNKNLL